MRANYLNLVLLKKNLMSMFSRTRVSEVIDAKIKSRVRKVPRELRKWAYKKMLNLQEKIYSVYEKITPKDIPKTMDRNLYLKIKVNGCINKVWDEIEIEKNKIFPLLNENGSQNGGRGYSQHAVDGIRRQLIAMNQVQDAFRHAESEINAIYSTEAFPLYQHNTLT